MQCGGTLGLALHNNFTRGAERPACQCLWASDKAAFAMSGFPSSAYYVPTKCPKSCVLRCRRVRGKRCSMEHVRLRSFFSLASSRYSIRSQLLMFLHFYFRVYPSQGSPHGVSHLSCSPSTKRVPFPDLPTKGRFSPKPSLTLCHPQINRVTVINKQPLRSAPKRHLSSPSAHVNPLPSKSPRFLCRARPLLHHRLPSLRLSTFFSLTLSFAPQRISLDTYHVLHVDYVCTLLFRSRSAWRLSPERAPNRLTPPVAEVLLTTRRAAHWCGGGGRRTRLVVEETRRGYGTGREVGEGGAKRVDC